MHETAYHIIQREDWKWSFRKKIPCLQDLKNYFDTYENKSIPRNTLMISSKKKKTLNRSDLLRENKMNDKQNSLYITSHYLTPIIPKYIQKFAIIRLRWKTENIFLDKTFV